MNTPRNEGLPELLPCGECGMPTAVNEYHPYAACLMFKACKNSETVRANLDSVRRASPQPLLSREPEPVSNASVTVGGVRVPGPMELNEANLLRYGADYLDGWNSYDEHLRLNPAAEVGEVETDEVNFVCSALGNLFAGDKVSSEEEQIINRARLLLRRLAGSGWIGMGTLDAMLHEGVPAHVAEKVMKLIRGEQ